MPDSTEVIVIATLLPAPGRRDDVVAALTSAIERVHAEDENVLLYAMHEGPDRIVMIEKYTSAAALAAHAKSAALAELMGAIDGALTEPMDVQVLTARPVGMPSKGQL
jgi:quinol monooxygenase YgiN